MCFERRPRMYVFSTIHFWRNFDGHRQRNNSECDAVEKRKYTSVRNKEKDFRWVSSIGDPGTIAIRTFVTNEDLHHQWTRSCLSCAWMRLIRLSIILLHDTFLSERRLLIQSLFLKIISLFSWYVPCSCGEWVNDYDWRRYCLCQSFGHVYHRPIFGRLTCRALARKITRRSWVFCWMEGRTIVHIDIDLLEA